MKYLLIEPKSRAIDPNIALMKFARWCELNNHQYQYVRGIVKPDISADIGLMSCLFSYDSQLYEKTIDHYLRYVDLIRVGGVFPSLSPDWFKKSKWLAWGGVFDFKDRIKVHQGLCSDIDNLIPKYNINIKSEDTLYPCHNIVLYASRGCVNNCGYCAVPKLEGPMKPAKSIRDILETARQELPRAKGVVLYDNNFTEHAHFDHIVNELIDFGLPIDIHGLHVESFTRAKAKLLSHLNWNGQGEQATPYIRFSFDKMKYFPHIKTAYRYIIDEKIKANMCLYVLFNFNDSPKDFWNKIQKIQTLVDEYKRAIFLFPMRYEPLMSLERHKYISPKWTEIQVRNLVKLYTGTRNFLPITKTRTISKYLGDTEQEFIDIISRQKLKDLPEQINKGFSFLFGE